MQALTTTQTSFKQHGFTLLEVMLVLLLMGLAVGTVMFNAIGSNYSEDLSKQAKRFQVIFDMASDQAVLNQQQLGLRIEQQTYEFYLLDDEQNWQKMEQDKLFANYEMPEPFSIELQLEGLPWEQEENLFDQELFDEGLSVSEDGVEIGEEEEKKLPPPQVLLLSSGDITPFSLIFKYEPEFGNDQVAYYRVNGQDTTPLQFEGPLSNL